MEELKLIKQTADLCVWGCPGTTRACIQCFHWLGAQTGLQDKQTELISTLQTKTALESCVVVVHQFSRRCQHSCITAHWKLKIIIMSIVFFLYRDISLTGVWARQRSSFDPSHLSAPFVDVPVRVELQKENGVDTQCQDTPHCNTNITYTITL